MKRIRFGIALLMLSVLARGDGEALYKRGTKVYKSDPAQAFGLFVQAAGAGNSAAMTGAGHCCETGTGTSVDYAKAIEWYEKAIQHNSLKACEGLARIYASCDNPEFHNGEKAVKYASVIARKKPREPEALALLAAAYARNLEFDRAVKAQRSAQRIAPLDCSEEYKRQISKYEEGEPCPPKASDSWILQAADAESHWSTFEAAKLYADRESPIYDLEKAIKWCQLAIDAGKGEAYVLRGDVYFYSDQASALERAQSCYREALSHGVYNGKRRPLRVRYVNWLSFDSERIFAEAKQSGKSRIEKREMRVSQDNEGYSTIPFTYCYPPDVEKARFLYRLAIKKGHATAKQSLELLATSSINQDMTAEALRILKKAEQLKLNNRSWARNEYLDSYLQLYLESYELDPTVQQGAAAAGIFNIYVYLGRVRDRNAFHNEFRGSLSTKELNEYQQREAIYRGMIDTWDRAAADCGNPDALRRQINLFATTPDPTNESAQIALKYAQKLLSYNPTKFNEWDGIAMAYARNGKFKEAVQFQQKAIEALRKTPKGTQNNWDTMLEDRMALYKQGKPYSPYEQKK